MEKIHHVDLIMPVERLISPNGRRQRAAAIPVRWIDV
jgi:hypothetical protein